MRNIRRIIATTAIVATSTVGLIASAGHVSASSCPTRSTTKPFTAWGDHNNYFVIPGGTFESSPGWSYFGNVSVVNDQAPWKVNGSTHSKALNLPAYTTAMPPNMCIASNVDLIRFFYKDPGVSGARLLVKIEAWNTAGTNGRVIREYRLSSGSSGWKLSPTLALPNNRDSKGEQMITITITPVDKAATWRIDDVMLDPWIAR
jgi:hypothetical protein